MKRFGPRVCRRRRLLCHLFERSAVTTRTMLRTMATLELSSASARTGIVPTNGWRRSLRRQCIVGVCVAELALMIVNGFSALPQAKLAMLRRRFSHNVNE